MKNRLIFVIFLIWAAVVIYFFNSALPADLKRFTVYLSGFSAFFNLKGSLAFLLDSLIELFLACFLVAISYIIGRKLTASLKKDFDTPGFFAVSAAAGFLVIAGFIFLLAAGGLLYEGVIFTAFLILCVYALYELYHNPSGVRFEPEKYSGAERILLLIIGVFMLGSLFLALTPETFFDSLEYHLAIPSAYILNHGFVKMPYNIFSGFPGNAELLYLVGLVLNGAVTAKLINFLFGVLLLVSVYSFGKKYFSRQAGLFAAALFCIMPLVAVNLVNTQVDALSAFWFFLAFYLTVNSAEKGFTSVKMLALAGLFAGFGMGIKYSGLIYTAGIVAVLFYFLVIKKAFRKAPYLLSIFCFFALIPILPWLVKNYLFFGNPFYPYFSDLPGVLRLLAEQKGVLVNNAVDFVKLPWTLTMSAPFASMNPGPALLAFLPFIFWPLFKKSREKKPFWALLAFIAVSLIFWLSLTRIVRFYIPGLIFLCVYFGYAITGLLKEEKDEYFVFTAYLVLAVIAFHNLIWVSNVNFRNMDPVSLYSGKLTKDAYLSSQKGAYPNPYFKAVDFVNKFKTDPGSKVLFAGESRAFYCKKPFIAGTFYDKIPLVSYMERSKSEGGLKKVLKKENISLVLVNLREARRLLQGVELLPILKSKEFVESFDLVYNDGSSELYVFLLKK